MIIVYSRYDTTWRRQVGGKSPSSMFLSPLNSFWYSFVLAATDHLRQKIMKLEARMHSLEDAIAIVHDSDTTHPLLASLGVEEEEEESMLSLWSKNRNRPLYWVFWARSTLTDMAPLVSSVHLEDQRYV